MRNVLMARIARPAVRISAAAVLGIGLVGGLAMTGAAASSSGKACSPTVSRQPFGKTIEPYTGKLTQVFRYTLTNCNGMQVRILSYGAITQSVTVPDRHGHKANVVLGFKTLQDYVNFDSPPVTANGGPYFGETIGRYGNRIAKGTFQLNGQTYTLPINNGVNSLHGGLVGFGNHIWASHGFRVKSVAGVVLRLVSPNGDASGALGSPGCANGCTGYPAKITVFVTYALNNAGDLAIHYRVHNDSKKLSTVTNLTNHSYFNLAGEASAGGLGIQPVRPDEREQLLADRQHPDPAAAGEWGSGQGHAVRLPRAAHHRLADRRRERAGQRPGELRVGHRRQEPAAHRPGL